jgi:hypothetical protein
LGGQAAGGRAAGRAGNRAGCLAVVRPDDRAARRQGRPAGLRLRRPAAGRGRTARAGPPGERCSCTIAPLTGGGRTNRPWAAARVDTLSRHNRDGHCAGFPTRAGVLTQKRAIANN